MESFEIANKYGRYFAFHKTRFLQTNEVVGGRVMELTRKSAPSFPMLDTGRRHTAAVEV